MGVTVYPGLGLAPIDAKRSVRAGGLAEHDGWPEAFPSCRSVLTQPGVSDPSWAPYTWDRKLCGGSMDVRSLWATGG